MVEALASKYHQSHAKVDFLLHVYVGHVVIIHMRNSNQVSSKILRSLRVDLHIFT